MTLKYNRAPLLCYFKFCASFYSHQWIQNGVTAKKKLRDFGTNCWFSSAVRPWNLTDDLEKQNGTSPNLLQALCIISLSLVNSNWSHRPETPNLGQNLRIFVPCHIEIRRMTLKTIEHLFYATSSSVHWTNRKNNSHRCRLVRDYQWNIRRLLSTFSLFEMRQAPSAVHMPTTRPVLCVIRLYPFSAEVSRYIYFRYTLQDVPNDFWVRIYSV